MEYGLYNIVDPKIPKTVMVNKNKAKSWKYGYDPKYDIVIISRDGTLGDVYEINSLKIGIPKTPSKVNKGENRWQPSEYTRTQQNKNHI